MRFGRKFLNILTFFILSAAAAALIIYSGDTGGGAREGLILCADVVIPALFPFFVISALAVELGAAQYAGFIFEPFMRSAFNVGGACSPAFVLGLIGGYPIGAKTAVSLYEKKLCSKTEAERLLAFCNNSGPAFILGVAGAGIFRNPKLGLLLYLVHVAAAVSVGVIFRFYKYSDKPARPDSSANIFKTCKISRAFIVSVRSAFDSVLGICSFVILFSVIIKMLYIFNIIPYAAKLLAAPLSLFGFCEADARLLAGGFFEITSGLWSVSKSSSPLIIRLALSSFMLGWAGISVHCQVLSFTGGTDLSLTPYFSGKFISAVLSAVYSCALFRILRFEKTVFSPALKITDVVKVSVFYKVFLISSVSCILIWNIFILLAVISRKIRLKASK